MDNIPSGFIAANDILTKIKAALADRTATIVARQTGLSRQTIDKYRKGKTNRPEFVTVKILTEYLGIKND